MMVTAVQGSSCLTLALFVDVFLLLHRSVSGLFFFLKCPSSVEEPQCEHVFQSGQTNGTLQTESCL